MIHFAIFHLHIHLVYYEMKLQMVSVHQRLSPQIVCFTLF